MNELDEFRLFSCPWLGKHNSNVEKNHIGIYGRVILFICGTKLSWTTLPLLWIFAGCWTLEWRVNHSTRGDGSQGTYERCIPVWKPASDSNSSWCFLDATGQKKHREKMKIDASSQKVYNVGDTYSPYCLPFPRAPLRWQAFLWIFLFWWGTGKPLLMAASAEVGGSPEKQYAPRSQAGMLRWCCGSRATAERGQEAALARRCVSPEWAAEGTDLPREDCLVTHHILAVPGKYNKARGSQGCFCSVYGVTAHIPLADSLHGLSLKSSQD